MKKLILIPLLVATAFPFVIVPQDNNVNASNIGTDYSGNVKITPGNGSSDAFGRLRVSNPETLFDSKLLHDKVPLLWNEKLGGSGVATYQVNNASILMTVSNDGDYAISQSYMRFNYQPGKSHQILQTFCLGTGSASVIKRVGYFNTSTNASYTNERDGVYLEQDGVNQYIVISMFGTANRVIQSNWDDPLDGSGASGITVDWSKVQIIMFSMEWLGVGSLGCALVIDGAIIPFHKFKHANLTTTVYMSSPNHSIRYEIFSYGGTNNLLKICSSVNSEGGTEQSGVLRCASSGGNEITLTNENTKYALIGLRLKTNYLDISVFIRDAQLQIQTATEQLEWQVIFNPTIAGTPIWNDVANSSVQFCLSSNGLTVTGGTVTSGGYGESGNNSSGAAASTGGLVPNALRLGVSIDGVRDTIFFVAKPIAGSTAIQVDASLFWREQL